jgi:predicted transposase YbfD/YdcC
MLCLEGTTVTIDAIGCQREISRRIVEKKESVAKKEGFPEVGGPGCR